MQDWICSFCIKRVLSFYKVRYLHTLDSLNHNENEIIEYQNKHLGILKKHHCYTSAAHVNTQSLPSSFYESPYMMNKYKFDIVETWLDFVQYLQVDGYKSEFKNRESKS